ncbi:hypothetical protein B2G71_18765 [Novosphingobium sp. PC22D]|nr:hypothetical protein B2G71_18765 [Novosphingobium sp. PC22D]
MLFRDVNRRGDPDYDPGLQRHHILPRQIAGRACFGTMFDDIGRQSVGFDDFRCNGLLLPCDEPAAVRFGLPLHRGPHWNYNALVAERVGRIESDWSRARLHDPLRAIVEARMRLALLQGALRRFLLGRCKLRLRLNTRDPAGIAADFSDLDALVDSLWGVTDPGQTEEASAVDPVRSESARSAA